MFGTTYDVVYSLQEDCGSTGLQGLYGKAAAVGPGPGEQVHLHSLSTLLGRPVYQLVNANI